MLPKNMLTHLQFAIIDILGDNELSGRVVRQKLGKKCSIETLAALASFYLLMKRMEGLKFIKGRYRVVDSFRERFYRVLKKGLRAGDITRDWYYSS